MTVLILIVLMLFGTMVYGPIAAMLVEMFPSRIRYTAMSLPYHLGIGWFGGFLPGATFAGMGIAWWGRGCASRCKAIGVAVAIDLGEWNELHPDNKKDIGLRLALAAQKMVYGENIVYSGPIYQSATIEGNKIIISFNNTGSGLISIDGEELSQFAIAGADKKFVWAKARIDGDKVIVWNDAVTDPIYVRYAWADNPAGCNLYNKEGLPASPFRTDK